MKIGIDGKAAMLDKGKNGERRREFIRMMADAFPDCDFYIYTPKLPKLAEAKKFRDYHNVRVCLPPPSGFGGVFWRLFGVTNNLQPDGVDLFHGIDGRLPLNIFQAGKPTVLTIDETVLENARQKGLAAKIVHYILGKSCANADVILTEDLKELINRGLVASIEQGKVRTVKSETDEFSKAEAIMNIYHKLIEDREKEK